MFDQGVRRHLQNETQGRAQSQFIVAERMSAIGRMACTISHDMRHSLSAIYANAEFLERHDLSTREKADLVVDIQDAVLAMIERLD
jgi:C4-dicarboxylate-specific signal transduction histidine kinase